MKLPLLVTACVAAIVAFSLRSDLQSQALMWSTLVGGHVALGALAAARLHRRGVLLDVLKLHRGDPSRGVITGLGLLAAAWLIRSGLIGPGSPQQAWVFNVRARIGDIEGAAGATACLLGLVALEELIWRGLVLRELSDRLGRARAIALSALLYSVALAPTLVTLGDPVAGPNPLLAMAALGCGLIWGYLAATSERLWPSLVSHCVFSYFGAAWLLGSPTLVGAFS